MRTNAQRFYDKVIPEAFLDARRLGYSVVVTGSGLVVKREHRVVAHCGDADDLRRWVADQLGRELR